LNFPFPNSPSQLPAQEDAEALRIKVTYMLVYLLIGGSLFFIASYVVTGNFALIPYVLLPYLLPALFVYFRLKKHNDYHVMLWFMLYFYTTLGVAKLIAAPNYLVDAFLLPTNIGAAFLVLKYRHALLMVMYLLALYAIAAGVVYWFEPFTIVYANDNIASLSVAFIISIVTATLIFYVFSKNYQQNSELLGHTLQTLRKINDDNRLVINVVSHDFRNYLVRVLLQIDTYKNKTNDPAHLQELSDLEAAIHKLSDLISDVQVVRDLSGDKTSHARTLVPFGEILKKIELLFRHEMVEKELSFNKDKVGPLQLSVNPDIFIHIILANLIGNAIKFSPPQHEIALALETRAGIPVLTIANDAPAEHLDNLRKLVSGEEVASAPGTSLEMGQGLGIAIMRKFCHAYDIEYALSVALLPDARLCRVTSRLTFMPD
jgi:signal transduction histidine kinase